MAFSMQKQQAVAEDEQLSKAVRLCLKCHNQARQMMAEERKQTCFP
jgi:bacterioferritin-associated ferredoxin